MHCQMCSVLGGNNEIYEKDQIEKLKAHALVHYDQHKFVVKITLEIIFEKCFPGIEFTSESSQEKLKLEKIPQKAVRKKRRKFDQRYNECLQILKKQLNQDRVVCKLCGTSLKVHYLRGGIHLQYVLDHVISVHLRKTLFHCRLCDHKTGRKKTVLAHLRNQHKTPVGTTGNYDDFTRNHLKEIVGKFHECYGFNGETVVKSQTKQSVCKNQTKKRKKPTVGNRNRINQLMVSTSGFENLKREKNAISIKKVLVPTANLRYQMFSGNKASVRDCFSLLMEQLETKSNDGAYTNLPMLDFENFFKPEALSILNMDNGSADPSSGTLNEHQQQQHLDHQVSPSTILPLIDAKFFQDNGGSLLENFCQETKDEKFLMSQQQQQSKETEEVVVDDDSDFFSISAMFDDGQGARESKTIVKSNLEEQIALTQQSHEPMQTSGQGAFLQTSKFMMNVPSTTPFILNDFSSTSSSVAPGENDRIRYVPNFVPIQAPQEIDFRGETPPARNFEDLSIFLPQLPLFGSAQLVSPFLALSFRESQDFRSGNGNDSVLHDLDLASVSATECPSMEPGTCNSDLPFNDADFAKDSEDGNNAMRIQDKWGQDGLSSKVGEKEKIDDMTRLGVEIEKPNGVKESEKKLDETALIQEKWGKDLERVLGDRLGLRTTSAEVAVVKDFAAEKSTPSQPAHKRQQLITKFFQKGLTCKPETLSSFNENPVTDTPLETRGLAKNSDHRGAASSTTTSKINGSGLIASTDSSSRLSAPQSQKKTFECCYCSTETTNQNSMRDHVLSAHSSITIVNGYYEK